MGREKALAFIAISFIAILFVLKTFTVLHARGSLFEGPRKRPVKPIQIEVGGFGRSGCRTRSRT